LQELRVRADTLMSIAESDYEAFCAALDQEPVAE